MIYKIYNPSLKKYSVGGVYSHRWSNVGKSWDSIKNLKAHLRLARDYTDCEIICYEPVLSVKMKDIDNIELLRLQKYIGGSIGN